MFQSGHWQGEGAYRQYQERTDHVSERCPPDRFAGACLQKNSVQTAQPPDKPVANVLISSGPVVPKPSATVTAKSNG